MKSGLSTDTRTHAPAGNGDVSNPDCRLLSINLLPPHARSPSAEGQRPRGRAPQHRDHERHNIRSNNPQQTTIDVPQMLVAPRPRGEPRRAAAGRGWKRGTCTDEAPPTLAGGSGAERGNVRRCAGDGSRDGERERGRPAAAFCGVLVGGKQKKKNPSREERGDPGSCQKGQMSVAAYVTGSPHISAGSSVSSTHDSITAACLSPGE